MSRRIAMFVLALLVLGSSAVPADAKRRTFGSRTLEIGMKGTDVRVLQDFLRKSGFRTAIDGYFGPGTRSRVRSWERRNARAVDGRVTRPDAVFLREQVEVGGAAYWAPPPATGKATIGPDGLAVAPADAPDAVKAIIAAGNEIHDKPYRYGGGHGDFKDSGYDCSGSVSYALHGGGLLERPMASGDFTRWGKAGKGTWITTYANSGHMYMVVAGLRFDTSARKRGGSRWTTERRSTRGYVARHPAGL